MDYKYLRPEGVSPRARVFIIHKALHTMLHLLYIALTIGQRVRIATVDPRRVILVPKGAARADLRRARTASLVIGQRTRISRIVTRPG